MRLLLLGGTAWLGREVAAQAARAGHEVVCVARGRSGEVAPGCRMVPVDRDREDALATVAGESWDAVVDVSRQPGHVRRAAQQLRRAQHFVFVSTGNVYADHVTAGLDESAPLLEPLAGDVMSSMEEYGEAKVACEQAVLDTFGDRATIARSGLIGGPGDRSDRTGYWPLRFAHPAGPDGAVLVPDSPVSTQVLDVRDLAAWLVRAGLDRATGVVNASGPVIPLGEHLDQARDVAGHRGETVPVDQDWLAAHHVQPWSGERSLPLWLPLPEYAGFMARSTAAAEALGLVSRPLTETLSDSLAWEVATGPGRARKAGLSAVDEVELLGVARR